MSDREDSFSPQPRVPHESGSGRTPQAHVRSYEFGLILTLVGNVLVVATLFLPWIEVYKIDPTSPIPTQENSPWTALQRGHIDSLGVAAGIYALLVLGLVITEFARWRRADSRIRVDRFVDRLTLGLALVGLGVVSFVLEILPKGLPLSYPYYDFVVAYGGYLAAGGYLSVLFGAVFAGTRR